MGLIGCKSLPEPQILGLLVAILLGGLRGLTMQHQDVAQHAAVERR